MVRQTRFPASSLYFCRVPLRSLIGLHTWRLAERHCSRLRRLGEAMRVWRGRVTERGLMAWLMLLAAGLAVWRALTWDSALLAAQHDNQIFVLPITVASLARGDGHSRTFTAQLDAKRPQGLPEQVRVSWRALPGGQVSELVPGQRWRMALVLRRPYGPANPYGPHHERRLHAERVGATATVRGQPRLLAPPQGHWLERARHDLRERLAAVLGERPYAAVIIALVMGDQQSVRREDWHVFNRTGITHLVSISGLHVTMLAGLAAAVARGLWPRLRWRGYFLAEIWAAQRVAAMVAVLVAWRTVCWQGGGCQLAARFSCWLWWHGRCRPGCHCGRRRSCCWRRWLS